MPILQRWRNQVTALRLLAAGQVPAGFRRRCHGSPGCRLRTKSAMLDSSSRWRHSQTGAAPAAQSPGNEEHGAGRSSRWFLLCREGDWDGAGGRRCLCLVEVNWNHAVATEWNRHSIHSLVCRRPFSQPRAAVSAAVSCEGLLMEVVQGLDV